MDWENYNEWATFLGVASPLIAAAIAALVAWTVMKRNLTALQTNNQEAINAAKIRENENWKRDQIIKQANEFLNESSNYHAILNHLYNDIIEAIDTDNSVNFMKFFQSTLIEKEKMRTLCISFSLVADKAEEDLWKLPFKAFEKHINVFDTALDHYVNIARAVNNGEGKDVLRSRVFSFSTSTSNDVASCQLEFVQSLRDYLGLAPIPVSVGPTKGWNSFEGNNKPFSSPE